MPLTLLHGPAGGHKTESLRQLSSEKPGALMASSISFSSFLLKTLQHNISTLQPCSLRNTRNIIRKLLYLNDYHFLNNGKIFPGFIAESARTLVQLKKNGLDALRARKFLKDFVTPELDSLLNLLQDYQKELQNHSLADEGDLILLTLRLIREKKYSFPPDLKRFYFDRLFPLTLGEREVFKEWVKNFANLEFTLSYSFDYADKDDSFFYPAYSFLGELASQSSYFPLKTTPHLSPPLSFPDPATESAWIMVEVKKLLSEGIKAEKIGVLMPGAPYYHRRLNDLFEEKGIPFAPPFPFSLELFPRLKENFSAYPPHSPRILLEAIKQDEEFEKEWESEKEKLLSQVKDPSLLNVWKKEERRQILVSRASSSEIPSTGIPLFTLEETPSYDFSHLFIVGFTDKNYPKPIADHLFYSPELLNHPLMREILEGPSYRVEKEKRALLNLIQRTENKIIMTYPRVFWDRKEQRVSSFAGLFPEEINSNAPSLHRGGPMGSPAIDGQTPSKRPAGRHGSAPTIPVFPKITQNRWSLTSLETYLKCPYQFYAQQILGLGRLSPDSPEVPPDVKGSLIHRVMQQLLSGDEPLYREAIAYDLYLERLIKKAEKILKDVSQGDVAFQKSLTPLKNHFLRRAHEAIGNYLRLEISLFRQKKKKTYPKYFEWSFGKKQIPPYKIKKGNSEVWLTGRIDRIDVNDEAKLFSVIDYKTGNLNSRTKLLNGESLQLPIYLLAVGELLLKGYQPSGAYLAGFAELKLLGLFFEGKGEEKIIEKVSPMTLNEWQALKEKTEETIVRIVGEILNRNFAPKPRETSLCRSCDYRDICHYDSTYRKPDACRQ